MDSKKLTTAMWIRVSPDLKKKFDKKASKYGTSSEVMREFMLAFLEDRITIEAPKNTLFGESK